MKTTFIVLKSPQEQDPTRFIEATSPKGDAIAILVEDGVLQALTKRSSERLSRTVSEILVSGEDVVAKGFSEKDLKDIRERLEPLIQKECPFDVKPETNTPVTWVRPELVCEVAFSGWTGDAVMRQPVFLRLREDKAARDVIREGPEGDENDTEIDGERRTVP